MARSKSGASKSVMENFSKEEEAELRAFLFTNPHGDDGFVYPQPLVAGEELSPLMSAVSRTHVSLQDRTLQFLDKEKTEQTRAMLPLIKSLMDVFRLPDGTLKISRRTTNFNKEWVLAHSHSSIKEGTVVFGHSENISDITGKKITGHPVIHPQVKSTRYIPYKKVLSMSLDDEDIASLPEADSFFSHIQHLNAQYKAMTEQIAEAVFNSSSTGEIVAFLKQPAVVEMEIQKWVERKRKVDEDFNPSQNELQKQRTSILAKLEDKSVRKDLGRFALDYSRVYLPAVNKTSLVYSVDARTIEEIITDLISSPRKEDQRRGQALWDEAKKIAPVLLGEKSHIHIDNWRVKNEQELREYMQNRFGHITPLNHGEKMVNLLTPRTIEMYNDRFNAALVVFQYVDAALQDIMAQLSDGDVKDVLARAHEHRGEFDVIHPAIAHGGLLFELVMGYHGYRDIFRHRRGSRTTQLLNTRLGFEVPEIFRILGFDKEYLRDMQVSAELYEKARKTSPHTAEKLVPFGSLCRALHSWQVNQIGYMGALRSNIATGNLTYVYMTREMVGAVAREMPETAKYFKYDTSDYPVDLWKKGYPWYDATQRKE